MSSLIEPMSIDDYDEVSRLWNRTEGVGTQLVETALARLKEIGIPKCNIFVFADNGSGERFWTRPGWTTRADLQVLQKALT